MMGEEFLKEETQRQIDPEYEYWDRDLTMNLETQEQKRNDEAAIFHQVQSCIVLSALEECYLVY